MTNQKVLDYVDSVMSRTKASDELKVQLENQLIRSIIKASESTSINEVKSNFCSPEKLAENLSKKVANDNLYSQDVKEQDNELVPMHNDRRYHHPRYRGEYMSEHSNVNLKLLYIPLIQISSGTERTIMPLMDDDYDD